MSPSTPLEATPRATRRIPLDDHALALDILDAEPSDLRDAQNAGIDGHQESTVLDVGDGGEGAADLVSAEGNGHGSGRRSPRCSPGCVCG